MVECCRKKTCRDFEWQPRKTGASCVNYLFAHSGSYFVVFVDTFAAAAAAVAVIQSVS